MGTSPSRKNCNLHQIPAECPRGWKLQGLILYTLIRIDGSQLENSFSLHWSWNEFRLTCTNTDNYFCSSAYGGLFVGFWGCFGVFSSVCWGGGEVFMCLLAFFKEDLMFLFCYKEPYRGEWSERWNTFLGFEA